MNTVLTLFLLYVTKFFVISPTPIRVKVQHNPLIPVAISKLLEMIDRFTYILACSIATALDSDINGNL